MNASEIPPYLTDEAIELLTKMIEAHLSSSSKSREFLISKTFAGTELLFTGDGPFADLIVDETALNDLVELRLVRVTDRDSRGAKSLDIGPLGREVYKLLIHRNGGSVHYTETSKVRSMESGQLHRAHSTVTRYLNEALAVLMTGDTHDDAAYRVGVQLRGALHQLTSDLTDGQVRVEKPAAALELWINTHTASRAGLVLVSVAGAVTQMVNRLVHIRDEAEKGRPLEGWHELRRTVTLTTTLCYELAELSAGR